jgi:predicted ArsR family transcriptional regulator
MVSSRQQIIEYLSTKRAATALELSNILQVTPANVRHHLAILIRDGVVKNAGTRAPQGKGRPTNIYSLTIHTSENNLGLLASTLLSVFVQSLPSKDREPALRNLAKQLCANNDIEPALMNMTQRLYLAVQRLNEMNYFARWEARRQAPHIILAQCPYAEILEKHPEMCKVDAYLLEELIRAPVVQIEKLTHDSLGLPFCAFLVNVDYR